MPIPSYIKLNKTTLALECLNCGGTEPLPSPCSVHDVFQTIDEFDEKHKDCPPPSGYFACLDD